MLAALACLWNAPAGNFPLAFSDIPLSCSGTASSASPPAVGDVTISGAPAAELDVSSGCSGDCGCRGDLGCEPGIFEVSCCFWLLLPLPPSSETSSSSSSSPISKIPGDKGSSERRGVGRLDDARSTERETLGEFSTLEEVESGLSLRCWVSRSRSCCAPSRVKSRSASKRLWARRMA